MFYGAPNMPHDGSAYVEGVTNVERISASNHYVLWLQKPEASATDDLVDGQAITAGATHTFLDQPGKELRVNEDFGRTVQVTSNAALDVTIKGRDYLGTIIEETISGALNTAVATDKAFKVITSIKNNAGNGTFDIGRGPKFGLPYVASKIEVAIVDGASGSLGTLVAADKTVPVSDTTGDTRGTYTPASAPNGEKEYHITLVANPQTPGGLYGVNPRSQ